MKLLLVILSSALVVQAGPTNCEIKIKDVCYEREVLRSGLDLPYNLAVDTSTNTLYFNSGYYKSAKININTKSYDEIEAVKKGFTHAVDPKTHIVYIGGTGGIFKYDPTTDTAEYYGAKGVWAETLYFKDTLFYSNLPDNFLYTLSNGQSTRYADLADTQVHRIVFDNDGDIFFTNATGLYSRKKGTQDTVLYVKAERPKGLAVDSKGNVYCCLDSGITAVKKATKSLEPVVEVDRCYGVAFDSDDNIIYSDSTSLVRVKPKTA